MVERYLALAAVSTVIFALIRRRTATTKLALPPGPPKHFLLGNIPDMPTEQEWLTYEKWTEEYGDIVHLRVGGQDIILLNTYEAAFELFERRSSQYSDRADFIMINEFAGFSWSPSTMRYGPEWRKHRTMLHRMFHPTACDAFLEAQTVHSFALLERLVRPECEDPMTQIRHVIGALIMDITYGIKVQDKNDPWIALCDEAVAIFSRVTVPGAFLVDAIPMLRYVPEWMPGAGWKRQARQWNRLVTRLADEPFAYVKAAMKSATGFKPCIVSRLLNDFPGQDYAQAARNVGAIVYAAGTDTTAAVLHVFLLAMVLHPEAQRAAQVELDTVVAGRFPTLDDRPQLPYCNALMKEVLRWHPIQPLNGGHVSTVEDVFRGYRIPKGASLHSNNWAMFRDPRVYGDDVLAFRPGRFLGPTPPRDPSTIFGFGRRACPGRFLADNITFLFASCILKAFDIVPPHDGSGVEAHFQSGFFSPPQSFKCEIRPRSDDMLQLILKSKEEA